MQGELYKTMKTADGATRGKVTFSEELALEMTFEGQLRDSQTKGGGQKEELVQMQGMNE